MIYKNGEQIAVSGEEVENVRQQLENEFQNKYITWQGENLLVTTVLQRIFEAANGKIDLVLSDEVPSTTNPNTQYWVKTYDGTTLTDGRFIVVTDSLNVATYVGQTNVDLSNLLAKPQTNYTLNTGDVITTQALKDTIIAHQPISVNDKVGFFFVEGTTAYKYGSIYDNSTTGYLRLRLMTIDKTTWEVSFNSVDVAGNSLADLITEDTPYTSSPADADTLDTLDVTTAKQKKITFANLWTWILNKISGITEKGIQISSGKLGHSNNITANTTNGIKTFAVDAQGHTTSYTAKTLGRGISDSSNVIGHSNDAITAKTNNNVVGVKWDGYGHITGKGTEHSISSEYKTGATNQLFTRNGANALYSGVYNGDSNMVFCGNVTRNSTQSVNSNTWTAISLTGSDIYRTGLISLASNGVKILKAGTYKFEFVIRLADTASATRHWCISAGTSSAFDDQGGGQWLYTYFRHKAEASHLRYCAANEVIKPYVYIDGNAGTVQFATVRVFKLNEK